MPWRKQAQFVMPTMAVSLLMLCLIAIAAWSLHRQQQDHALQLAEVLRHATTAEELMRNREQAQLALVNFLISDDRQDLDELPKLNQSAESLIQRMEELAFSDEDRSFVEQLREGMELLDEELESLIEEPPQLERSSIEFGRNLQRILNEQIIQPARAYRQVSRDRIRQLSQDNLSLIDRVGVILILLAVGGAFTGMLAGVLIARRIDDTLAQQEQALTRSEQLATLGRIAAAVAHELRNPLTSLRIIAQAATPHGDHKLLDKSEFAILEHELERMETSIQAFLDYARPPKLNKAPWVLQTLVQQTVSLVDRRAKVTDVAIRNLLPAEPITVEVDPAQFNQVILNLLLNALDATSVDGVIEIRADQELGDQGKSDQYDRSEFVLLSITDTGSGLPANLGPRIFEAFVSTKETGTGLGLAICKRIIEEHHGHIDARSTGTGSVFQIYLPRHNSN